MEPGDHKRNGYLPYPYEKETDGIRINTNAIFGWNPNTRDKKYMILIMSKKLTKLDGIQLMRKSFDTLLN